MNQMTLEQGGATLLVRAQHRVGMSQVKCGPELMAADPASSE
jgi:hypothetical protein